MIENLNKSLQPIIPNQDFLWQNCVGNVRYNTCTSDSQIGNWRNFAPEGKTPYYAICLDYGGNYACKSNRWDEAMYVSNGQTDTCKWDKFYRYGTTADTAQSRPGIGKGYQPDLSDSLHDPTIKQFGLSDDYISPSTKHYYDVCSQARFRSGSQRWPEVSGSIIPPIVCNVSNHKCWASSAIHVRWREKDELPLLETLTNIGMGFQYLDRYRCTEHNLDQLDYAGQWWHGLNYADDFNSTFPEIYDFEEGETNAKGTAYLNTYSSTGQTFHDVILLYIRALPSRSDRPLEGDDSDTGSAVTLPCFQWNGGNIQGAPALVNAWTVISF